MRGAGGTSGGLGQFFLGLIMMCGGFYLLFNAISVSSTFGLHTRIYHFSAFGNSAGLTSGMILIPLMLGIGLIFYNCRNPLGWLIAIVSLACLLFGVIASLRFNFRTMSAFDLISILVLAIGGLGLFLRSLREIDRAIPDSD